MTTKNSPLETSLKKAAPGTTVFSDGSTFDYEHGYQSNGAVPSRDKEPATIVKTGNVVSFTAVAISGFILIALIAFVGVLGGLLQMNHNVHNYKTIADSINLSGQAEVLDGKSYDVIDTLVVRDKSQQIFKCDVEYVTTDVPRALVFCAPGGPATFSIPLDYEPGNILYVAPKQDS